MRIRRAVSSDFPITASFSVPAFLDDELYRFLFPFAAQYPEDFRNFFLQRHRQRDLLPGQIYWIAVLDPTDGLKAHWVGHHDEESVDRKQAENHEGGRVVGFALWRRYGDSEEAKQWQTQTWAECMSWIASLIRNNLPG